MPFFTARRQEEVIGDIAADLPAHLPAKGSIEPQMTPPHATRSGCGFGDTSVREKASGSNTTRVTRPPLSPAWSTWPDSCTTIMPSHEAAMRAAPSRRFVPRTRTDQS